MHEKLIFIGIDGATWSILAPLISTGELHNFRALVSGGTVGVLHSTDPPESPPAWTSMFTGVNPGKHGIVDFVFYEGGKFVPCMSRYRMSETIWRIISDQGRKCIIINDPMTFPPEQVNGIMTTGFMTPPGSANWIYPKDRKDEIETVAAGYECDIPPDFQSIVLKDEEAALEILKRLTAKIFRVGTYAAFNLDWDVLAVIFTTTDRLQHFWWSNRYRITEFYKRIDAYLGEFIDCAKATSADLIVASDHGFGPCERFLSINGLLEEAGLAVRRESHLSRILGAAGLTRGRIRNAMGAWPRAFTAMPTFIQDAIRRFIPESGESLKELDAANSLAFAKTNYGIFIRNNDSQEIVRSKLAELRDQTTGKPIIDKVSKRSEVLHGPYTYRAPDLFLQPAEGFGLSLDKPDIERGYTGSHRSEGVFVHYRPNSISEPQGLGAPIRPWDVAATILHLLGVPLPDYFDGEAKIARK